ncbi:hypothetical protein ZIOFF_015244 [Zingiber officinale]|uniref:Uncharacterized protein n=1 Tax=Zingiber officinale TaxID=94328 RepID=A0A8J5HHW9_ZINOF|nr:hypothetical protein ZIOFF_015244 [Zingiber officinale]
MESRGSLINAVERIIGGHGSLLHFTTMSFEVSFLSRNMKDDPTGRQLYQLLTSMHDVFEQIREKISQLTELEGKLLSMRRNLQLFSLGLLTLEFTEPTPKEGISILKAISLAMVLLQSAFSDILKVNEDIQKLHLNNSGMDDYMSNNYMLCDTASEPHRCDWEVLRQRTIKKALGFKRERG